MEANQNGTATEKLLQRVVENARTGASACEQLIQRTRDGEMRGALRDLRGQYQDFERRAEHQLYAAGAHPAPVKPVDRAGMWLGIRLNTMSDASASHIADIAIQGANMGVVGMTRDLNDLSDASAEARALAQGFVAGQQRAVERLKPYL